MTGIGEIVAAVLSLPAAPTLLVATLLLLCICLVAQQVVLRQMSPGMRRFNGNIGWMWDRVALGLRGLFDWPELPVGRWRPENMRRAAMAVPLVFLAMVVFLFFIWATFVFFFSCLSRVVDAPGAAAFVLFYMLVCVSFTRALMIGAAKTWYGIR
ncbi:hypothetical protein NBH20_03385 [Rhizobium sp. S153]|uniref:Uncharacterized protein n=1 Tax=Ciceribacter sichuanensis TaxID=2949647 RepID=A0ABT0V4J6_9HYPH|nr:hypothetical protein [Ciceribacter sp. S153]MCM2400181.1 hypothetical protein [Ciceribacter sp. S153]